MESYVNEKCVLEVLLFSPTPLKYFQNEFVYVVDR